MASAKCENAASVIHLAILIRGGRLCPPFRQVSTVFYDVATALWWGQIPTVPKRSDGPSSHSRRSKSFISSQILVAHHQTCQEVIAFFTSWNFSRIDFRVFCFFFIYRISSYIFHGNYSFLNLEIVANSNSCRNISIFYLIN